MSEASRGRRLTRDDWIAAARAALEREGLQGVAVDRLTSAVGATRGSFYWHFRNRQSLVDALLEQWEQENTDALLPALNAIPDPVQRLRTLVRDVYEPPVGGIETALAREGNDPLVAATYARVTGRRLDVLTGIFTELGLDAQAAQRRAWWAYAFYVGHHALGQTPHLRPRRPDDLTDLVALLVSGRSATFERNEAPRA